MQEVLSANPFWTQARPKDCGGRTVKVLLSWIPRRDKQTLQLLRSALTLSRMW